MSAPIGVGTNCLKPLARELRNLFVSWPNADKGQPR